MLKFIIIRGPLGVGKTTVSKMLAKDLGFEYISVDDILDEYKLDDGDGIPVESFLKVNEIIQSLTKKETLGYVVDGNFYYQDQIDDFRNKFGNDISIFTLMSDVDTCRERDAQREKPYGKDAAEYVHMITSQVKAGKEIDTTHISAAETVEAIKNCIK
ncbi:MAG: hypothetical protein COU32_00610 [Candidatus Magasanikbacteria bacterium CG10_big_fil_rev_8_21_14_0_10_42_10]|uniref:Shikimate kinase n=2 Tax=Candidatus Magasanikiibacteriota TaxID=1752731 RepID=A0A2H0TX68_9BACT|nr:MAG: hypothetical protein COU32_00610 [Candidatus Magasanikbacteria bacterium CG10_big_fil_rev_8_21_14_0_10_42_10]PIZ94748.1 MAG: hypothetical protein COX82_00015 [Candidatus Magasanikbacteria bacterium CG_4_10_14_0_2_um_filter_41_10]